MIKLIFVALLLLFINTSMADIDARWYSSAQLKSGEPLFKQHCSSCHGTQAQGTLEWKIRDQQGFLPPPPLNGTAHTWHHDKQLLSNIIKEGGASYKGKMPAFNNVLNNAQIDSIIAFFQSTWSDDIYHRWANAFLSGEQSLPSFNDLLDAREKQIKQLKDITTP